MTKQELQAIEARYPLHNIVADVAALIAEVRRLKAVEDAALLFAVASTAQHRVYATSALHAALDGTR